MIARVFPTKTSMSPNDVNAYFGEPDMFTPKYDEVHISVTFTWDIEKGKELAYSWRNHGKVVKIGGVAIDGEPKTPMVKGMYLREGITITSRGCPNKCDFCRVKQDLIECDDFPEGNIVQDNNFTACSNKHQEKVFRMLKKQRGIEFKGGLEASRITYKFAEKLRALSIKTLWLACDHPNSLPNFKKAVRTLQMAGFTRRHIMSYVLIGNDMEEEKNRLYEVLNAGAMPFAMLYKDETNAEYSKEWKQFQREWARPAIVRSKLTRKERE